MSSKQLLKQWEEKERERRLKHNCDNPEYLANLILALKQAKRDKNIELIISLARELENAKIVCGASPMIEAFEHTLKDVSTHFDLSNNPTIQRSLAPPPNETLCPFCAKCEKRMLTMEAFTPLELHKDGTRSLFIPKEEPIKIAPMLTDAQLALRALESKNYEEQHRKTLFPETCTAACTHRQCPYYRLENFGKPCEKQQEQYKTAPTWLETRTLDPQNVPDYHSPQFREEKVEKPKKEMKESLNPM